VVHQLIGDPIAFQAVLEGRQLYSVFLAQAEMEAISGAW
jgi:hypothetical protein